MSLQLDVLLVDDNQVDSAFFERAARKSGLNIRLQTFTSALRVQEYLEGKEQYSDRLTFPWPHLVVIDLHMPRVSGFDFLTWRKRSTVFSSVPVVVLSGSFGPTVLKDIEGLGANKVLIKPNDLDDWEKVIREIWNLGTDHASPTKRPAGDGAN